MSFLENLGIVKTARREAESVLLLKALIQKQALRPADKNRFIKLAEKNKVLLRAAPLLDAPDGVVKKAKMEADEAMRLYDLMSDEFERIGVPFVVINHLTRFRISVTTSTFSYLTLQDSGRLRNCCSAR